MTNQNILKKPLEDEIVAEVAENLAAEMIAEIRDEVSVWIDKLPITSPKVRSTDITKAFQERFARQLVERQSYVAEQLILARREELRQIPAGRVGKEVLAIEAQGVLEKEGKFMAHVQQCALLASRIKCEKEAFEKVDEGIVVQAEKEMEAWLRRDAERWLEMGRVSEVEFLSGWEEKFGKVLGKDWEEMILKG